MCLLGREGGWRGSLHVLTAQARAKLHHPPRPRVLRWSLSADLLAHTSTPRRRTLDDYHHAQRRHPAGLLGGSVCCKRLCSNIHAAHAGWRQGALLLLPPTLHLHVFGTANSHVHCTSQLHTDVDLPLNKGEHPTDLVAYLERSPYGQDALELIATVFAVLLDSVGVRQGEPVARCLLPQVQVKCTTLRWRPASRHARNAAKRGPVQHLAQRQQRLL